MCMGPQELLIIGAGPKAMAIASKNKVLRQVGFSVPKIHIIEKQEVGANWTGGSGYTDGRLELGTSPEKDVGFPYESSCWNEELNVEIDLLMEVFSWQTFLIAERRFSSWVDRGRPAPQHREWATYLQWVNEQIQDETTYHWGEVDGIRIEGDRWMLGYRTPGGGKATVSGDGLVVTGPGRVRMEKDLPDHENLMTVENFWSRSDNISTDGHDRVAIVGTGETAAAVAMSLVQASADQVAIDIISPIGMTFSRGEGYRENRVYSNAEASHWSLLTLDDRRQFIRRTDRGVFSRYARAVLDRSENIEIVPGRLLDVGIGPDGYLKVHYEYAQETHISRYKYVVVATGADLVGPLRDMMDEETLSRLTEGAQLDSFTESEFELRVGHDLAIKGLTPKLHLPMLSGLVQGPGFANLSCLGRLSDRVLDPYLSEAVRLRRVV